jgi:signal transduction histidine kinase
MSFFKYLRDNIRLILLYFILIAFFSMMAFLDSEFRMQPGDALYTVIVSFVIFAVLVLIDYLIRRKQAKELFQSTHTKDFTPVLPGPKGYKDELYTAYIGRLYSHYMDALRIIEEEYREDREFMVAWVHEVKMPITAARLLLESGNYKQDSMLEEIERISECVEKVLYYSRSDSFSRDYVITEEDLNKLIRENVKKHSAVFIKKQISVAIDVPEGLAVYTDRKWLLFIMDQLLSNALKYTGEKGAIRIAAEKSASEVILCYNDNGRGIRKEDIARIFDKSFTGQNGRKPGSAATGLGLYLAGKLAKKLSHSITVSSEYGSGTSASIHFPMLDDTQTGGNLT